MNMATRLLSFYDIISMRKLKLAAFACFCIVIIVLIITTLLDKITDNPGTAEAVYDSAPFVLMWVVLTVLAMTYMLRRRLWKVPATMLIHTAFLVILCGALTTHLLGEHGAMRLRTGYTTNTFTLSDGKEHQLPFTVKLDTFHLSYYDGTMSPQDYTSCITITDGNQTTKGCISMNRIYSYRHYRFYQAGYDPDRQGSKLSIAHDPYGIGITYTGYALLLLGMILFFFQPETLFRRILQQKVTILALLAALGTTTAKANSSNMPKIAPTDVAETFSDLYILYNGRVCPVQTYAYDFITKLYGKQSYRGRKPEEILAGWIFFPNTWKPEPMIRIKGAEVKRLLGINDTYISLIDFATPVGDYKLEQAMKGIYQGNDVPGSSSIMAADEKVNIINSLFTGASLKIFPVKSEDGSIQWYSPADDLPHDMDIRKWTFIKKSLDLVAEKIVTRRYTEAKYLIGKIREYQQAECGDALPSSSMISAEKTYNRIASSQIWAMGCITIGLLAFFYFVAQTARQNKASKFVTLPLNIILIAVWAYLTYCIYLRTVISHHLPISNGFETMQALAWSCLMLTFFLQKKFTFALSFGFLVAGLALLVSMIGQSNPAITHLMPVLNSPLLSIHVMVIMIAYVLLAFIMLNGVTAIIFARTRGMGNEVTRLQRMSQLMLYPAVFLLTIGIFIGAIWANMSWGAYWSWDPKETWALITLMIYALPLHTQSLPMFSRPIMFHIYMTVAFLSCIMTYFGVNFILGGMHSYA